MEFGPEIKVDGKRPEWLKDDDWFMPISDGGNWSKPYKTSDIPDFDWLSGIRLPLGDARYANLTTHTYTVRPEDEAALLASDPLSRSTPDERAVALVKRLASLSPDHLPRAFEFAPIQDEARAILAALEPVDGDLVEARKVADELTADVGYYASGKHDDHAMVKVARTALARGRQLEKEGK